MCKCLLCNNVINLNEIKKNQIGQPFIIKNKDLIYFNEYDLFKLYKYEDNKTISYICDDCLNILISDYNVIIYNDEITDMSNLFNAIGVDEKNIYRSVPRSCVSFKLDYDNIQVVGDLLNFKLSDSYNINFINIDLEKNLFHYHIKIKEDHINSNIYQVSNVRLYNNDYIIFYSSNFDFEVLNEVNFQRRFSFIK